MTRSSHFAAGGIVLFRRYDWEDILATVFLILVAGLLVWIIVLACTGGLTGPVCPKGEYLMPIGKVIVCA